MPTKKCAVCKKTSGPSYQPLQKCSRCQSQVYCGRECQTADWPNHKAACKAVLTNGEPWYEAYRKCKDGTRHEGVLELITWSCPKEGTGWGHCFEEESADMKEKFEVKYGGDEKRFYNYWPQGFRWTCCGMEGDMKYGCDHHGTGKKPCTCDFCRMGQALPDRIYNEQSAGRMGLQLARGPDPRSYSASHAAMATSMRAMMGLDEASDDE
ncbi:hypothetical protein CPB83DRAFT_645991 [Crepidotus variabilis]|uniref:MYND-type domain-containing protein n=1 Tax=Crepidotus variabilis TaxID=179855 RepID=A0A9P6JKK7_9AGAR|nr:hypothetical protein CPB83DRAFT_645991 [Crepidotus variabilis]